MPWSCLISNKKEFLKSCCPSMTKNNLKEVSQTDFSLLCPINALRGWTPPNRKLIQIQNRKNPQTTGQTDRRTYYTSTQGIWPRGLRQQALRAIMGRALWWPKSDMDVQTEKKREREKDGETDRQIDRHIRSTGPWWCHPDPSVGIMQIFMTWSFLFSKQYMLRNISLVLW